MADNRKTIGQMNGPWAITLKLALASYPIVIMAAGSLSIWLVSQTFANQYHRETSSRRLLELEAAVDDIPPDWRKTVEQLDHRQRDMQAQLARMETILERLDRNP